MSFDKIKKVVYILGGAGMILLVMLNIAGKYGNGSYKEGGAWFMGLIFGVPSMVAIGLTVVVFLVDQVRKIKNNREEPSLENSFSLTRVSHVIFIALTIFFLVYYFVSVGHR